MLVRVYSHTLYLCLQAQNIEVVLHNTQSRVWGAVCVFVCRFRIRQSIAPKITCGVLLQQAMRVFSRWKHRYTFMWSLYYSIYTAKTSLCTCSCIKKWHVFMTLSTLYYHRTLLHVIIGSRPSRSFNFYPRCISSNELDRTWIEGHLPQCEPWVVWCTFWYLHPRTLLLFSSFLVLALAYLLNCVDIWS